MKKLIALLLITTFLVSCNQVPITGRKQVNLYPQSTMLEMSVNSYREFLNSQNVVTGTQNAQYVNTTGSKISGAAEGYLRSHGQKKRLENFQWEFNLVSDEQINAFAMPGGKVVFFEGIMDVCEDEAGTAVVMGHEIAHVIARHGNERMSQIMAAQLGGMALQAAVSEKPEQTQQIFMTAYGVGSQLAVILPFSRLHESEADKMGLVFMAMAGYNPQEAVDFWKRMHEKSQGTQPPEFLSTHPGHDTRIEDLQAYMDEAMKYYKPN